MNCYLGPEGRHLFWKLILVLLAQTRNPPVESVLCCFEQLSDCGGFQSSSLADRGYQGFVQDVVTERIYDAVRNSRIG